MKKIIIILLYLGFYSLISNANHYEITYVLTPFIDNNEPYLKVTMQFKGNQIGKTNLILPTEWAGINYSKQIKNIRLINTNAKYIINNQGFAFLDLDYIPGNNIQINYEIYQKEGNPANVHEAIIRKDLIHFPGYAIFALPEELYNHNKIESEYNIIWGNLPKEWLVASSYSTAQSFVVKGGSNDLQHAIYLAGQVRFSQKIIHNQPFYLSLYGHFDINDNHLRKNISNIISTQREYFNDYEFPYYFISLIEGDDPASMGGTRLHNSFTAYIPPKKTPLDYYILLAHEHLHSWTGGKIPNDENEEFNYWWSEGFTEYLTRILEFRSGRLSTNEFLEQMNSLLLGYYFSPVIHEPNSTIRKDFWKNHYIQQLPYQRGFVLALYLDYLIRIHSNHLHSLDNVMFDLFAYSQKYGKPFSLSLFIKLLIKYLPRNINQELDAYIIKGKTIKLDKLINHLPLSGLYMGIYDPGFNREAFNKDKIIKEIDLQSNAYKEGLRNGYKVLSFNLPKGHISNQMFEVITNKGFFKFRPESYKEKRIAYLFKEKLNNEEQKKLKEWFGVIKNAR